MAKGPKPLLWDGSRVSTVKITINSIPNALNKSGLRQGSVATRLLGLRVRIPPEAWMFVLCVFYSKDKRQKAKTKKYE